MPVGLVHHLERLSGVDRRVMDFFSWWHHGGGPFALTIAENGGLRTDAAWQEAAYNRGATRARTLDQTPHGVGMAADAYPAKVVQGTVVGIYTEKDPDYLTYFGLYGALAKTHGLVWGGDWARLRDYPHVEVPNWFVEAHGH